MAQIGDMSLIFGPMAKCPNAMEHQECLDLANHLRPAVKQLIPRQRSEYGFSETTTQFPVTEQAANIDEVPVHNLCIERYCGADAN